MRHGYVPLGKSATYRCDLGRGRVASPHPNLYCVRVPPVHMPRLQKYMVGTQTQSGPPRGSSVATPRRLRGYPAAHGPRVAACRAARSNFSANARKQAYGQIQNLQTRLNCVVCEPRASGRHGSREVVLGPRGVGTPTRAAPQPVANSRSLSGRLAMHGSNPPAEMFGKTHHIMLFSVGFPADLGKVCVFVACAAKLLRCRKLQKTHTFPKSAGNPTENNIIWWVFQNISQKRLLVRAVASGPTMSMPASWMMCLWVPGEPPGTPLRSLRPCSLQPLQQLQPAPRDPRFAASQPATLQPATLQHLQPVYKDITLNLALRRRTQGNPSNGL